MFVTRGVSNKYIIKKIVSEYDEQIKKTQVFVKLEFPTIPITMRGKWHHDLRRGHISSVENSRRLLKTTIGTCDEQDVRVNVVVSRIFTRP